MKNVTTTNLKKYVLNLLKRREYSFYEIRSKAEKQNYPKEIIEEVLDWLRAYDLASDERFTAAVIKSYSGKKGSTWIAQKLKTKGISDDLIQVQLSKLQGNIPSQIIWEKLQRKFNFEAVEELDWPSKSKLFGYLGRHGFSISDTLQHYTKSE